MVQKIIRILELRLNILTEKKYSWVTNFRHWTILEIFFVLFLIGGGVYRICTTDLFVFEFTSPQGDPFRFPIDAALCVLARAPSRATVVRTGAFGTQWCRGFTENSWSHPIPSSGGSWGRCHPLGGIVSRAQKGIPIYVKISYVDLLVTKNNGRKSVNSVCSQSCYSINCRLGQAWI